MAQINTILWKSAPDSVKIRVKIKQEVNTNHRCLYPAFVFTVLSTPPYMPLGIRRFLFWIPIVAGIRQIRVARLEEVFRTLAILKTNQSFDFRLPPHSGNSSKLGFTLICSPVLLFHSVSRHLLHCPCIDTSRIRLLRYYNITEE